MFDGKGGGFKKSCKNIPSEQRGFFFPSCNHSHCTNSTDFLRSHVRNQMAVSSVTGLTLVFNNFFYYAASSIVYIFIRNTDLSVAFFKKYIIPCKQSTLEQSELFQIQLAFELQKYNLYCQHFPDKFLSNMGTTLNCILLCK